ncbi:helix-turn-helix domain-containing protein [Streptomyces sp. NPDC007264]|uniref:AraC family transcriptional regulator n=1 Tax=Streptomyces sp. NPDC007264 TaxID=3364777 RepID=UPI0036DAE496
MTIVLTERTLPLPDDLRPWIDDAGLVPFDRAPRPTVTQAPDPATKLVVRVEKNGRRDALIIGPRARASYSVGKRLVSCVQLRLAPGTTRPLLGVPAAELVGRAVPLTGLPSPTARRLARELPDMALEQVVGHLAEVLPDRLATVADRSRTELLRAGVDAMSLRAGHIPGPVREVARDLAVSERQLRNLFAEGVGLSPKHYARINRVRAVLARATTLPWADLAASTGYYDQSHMTSDFRTLMGVPPRSFFTGRLPAAQPCQVPRRA